LVIRGTDPDPSIIKQKSKKNLDSYCFVTFLGLFIFEKYVNAPSKNNSGKQKNFEKNCFWRLEGH
jgi:hypothetical protein